VFGRYTSRARSSRWRLFFVSSDRDEAVVRPTTASARAGAEARARWTGFCPSSCRLSFGAELPRAATLKDKHRTLCFSAPSCPPCQRFTPYLPRAVPAVGLMVSPAFELAKRTAPLRHALSNSWLLAGISTEAGGCSPYLKRALAGYPRKQARNQECALALECVTYENMFSFRTGK